MALLNLPYSMATMDFLLAVLIGETGWVLLLALRVMLTVMVLTTSLLAHLMPNLITMNLVLEKAISFLVAEMILQPISI